MSVDALHWKYLDVLPFAVLAVLAGIFAAAFSWAAVKVHRFRLQVYTDRRFSGGTVGRCLTAPVRACCALRDRIDIITRRPTLPSKGVYLPLSVIRSAAKRDAAAEFDLHTPRGGVQPSTFRSRVLRGGQILCCGVGRAASQTASSSSSHQPLRSPRSVLRAKKMSDRRMKLAYVYIFLLSLSASLSRPLSASLGPLSPSQCTLELEGMTNRFLTYTLRTMDLFMIAGTWGKHSSSRLSCSHSAPPCRGQWVFYHRSAHSPLRRRFLALSRCSCSQLMMTLSRTRSLFF